MEKLRDTHEGIIPILRGLALRQARQRLLSSLLRRRGMWPYVEHSGINRDHFCNNRKWQEAFEMVRSGTDVTALVVANPTCETAHLWRLGVEMGAGAMFSLARQIVASVRAEEAATEIDKTAPRSSQVVEPKHGHPAKPGVIDLHATHRPTTQPKLVPPTAARSTTPPAKLAEAMTFLRNELQGEVAATEIEKRAQKAGIAFKTLKRARAKLGVVSRRDGFGAHGKFYLSLPWDHSGPTGA